MFKRGSLKKIREYCEWDSVGKILKTKEDIENKKGNPF